MDGSSSGDGNRRNGKRAADQSLTNKVKEPRRGMGIAKLEKMRAEEEMKEKYLKNPFSQAHISGAGIQVQGLMAHGTRGYMNEQFNLPFTRPISTSAAAAFYGNPSNTAPTTTTLQLFPDDHMEDDVYVDSKREDGGHNIPVEPTSKNSGDPQDLDLDLKL